MDEKHRNILDRNNGLLVGNIIMTDEFFQLLKTENVLPNTMILDIQTKKSQFERNTKLLETLRLRGGDAYRKFRHVLYLTGHQLLTDHLYSEDIDTKLLRAEEVFGKFPKIFKHVSDDVKSKLLRFLETKVKERAITSAWLTAGTERSEFLEAKTVVYESDKDCKLKLDNKIKKLAQMKDEIASYKEELQKRDEELTDKRKEIVELQLAFKQELAKQTRFNAANNSSIIQLKDRFENFNERVRIVNVAMQDFLETEGKDSFDEANNVKMSILERNVRKLIQVARTNIENNSVSINEKEAVLNILRASSKHTNQTLTQVVQQFVEKQERSKLALAKEIEQLLEIVRGQKSRLKMTSKPKTDLKYLKSQIAILREEVEHMKKKIEWKDVQLTDLIAETTRRVGEPSKQSSLSAASTSVVLPRLSAPVITRESPDPTRESAYQQYNGLHPDQYLKGSRKGRVRRGSLVDVNLERGRSPSPEIRDRRNSKFEPSDLDLFNTQPHYRRSYTDLGLGSSSFQSQTSYSSIDTMNTPRPASSTDDVTRYDVNHRKELNPEAHAYLKEGRRPSLAELITIYEGSQDDNVVDETDHFYHNQRLPVLQES